MLHFRIRTAVLAHVMVVAVASLGGAQSSVRPITVARVDQLIKGLNAEKAFWTPIWAKDRRLRDSLEKARERNEAEVRANPQRLEQYEQCAANIASRDTAAVRMTNTIQANMAKMSPARMQEFARVGERFGNRIQEAEEFGDERALIALFDSAATLSAPFLGVSAADQKRVFGRLRPAVMKGCGKRPKALSREEQDSISMAAMNEPSATLVSDTLTSDVGERASGLGDNYALLRELVILYINEDSAPPVDQEGALTTTERAAIRQRASVLRPLLEFLNSRGGLDS